MFNISDEILEEIFPEQINLKSFEEKSSLNPKIWSSSYDLKKIVRRRLYDIAQEFIADVDDMDISVEDIVLVGSIAGYNWSKYSDIDLHIILDYDKLKDYASKEILQQNFDRMKDAWNKKHKILIYGYEVEMYVQDYRSPNASDGIYSIKYGKWVKIPKGGNAIQDRELIKRQASQYLNLIDKYSHMAAECRSKAAAKLILHEVEKIYDEIREGRKEALSTGGEFGAGNIIFKIMRRTDGFDKMQTTKTLLYDKIRSI